MNEIKKKKPRKKHSIFRKILKITLITVASLLLFIGIIVGIVLYIVFTPEKTTKVVNYYANEYLNANVHFESVDITFISTFPQFYLIIRNGNIVSKTFSKTADFFPTAQDSLLQFQLCEIELDPIKYLKTKDVDIKNIVFKGIHAYIYTDPSGKANWEIFPSSEEDTTSTDFVLDAYVNSIHVANIEIASGEIVYDDQYADFYGKFNEMRMNLSGDFVNQKTDILFDLFLSKIEFRDSTTQLAKDVTMDLHTELTASFKENKYDLQNTTLDINGIVFTVDGSISIPDSDGFELDTRLHASIPTIEGAKRMIPALYVPILSTIDAEGNLDITGHIHGKYGRGVYPTAAFDFDLKNASFRHEIIGFYIENIQLQGNAYMDLNKKTPSFAKIKDFSFTSICGDLKTQILVDNIFTNPYVKGNVTSHIDITNVLHYFPFLPDPNMKVKGNTSVDLQFASTLNSITKQDWEKVNIEGSLDLRNIDLQNPADTLFVKFPSAHITFRTNQKDSKLLQEKYLGKIDITIDSLGLRYTTLADGKMKRVQIHSKLSPEQSDIATSLLADVCFEGTDLDLMQKIGLRSKQIDLQIAMLPNSTQISSPVLSCVFSTQATYVSMDSIKAELGSTKLNINLKPIIRKIQTESNHPRKFIQQYRDLTAMQTWKYLMNSFSDSTYAETTDITQSIFRYWQISTSLDIENVFAEMSMLQYPIYIPIASLSFDSSNVDLNKIQIKAKNSDITIEGRMANLRRALMGRGKYEGNLKLTSNNLNINELASVMNTTETENIATSDTKPETAVSMQVIEVPSNVNITLTTDIKHALYGKANFRNINGEIILRNQSILLNDLHYISDLGNMNITLVYKAINKTKADFSAELKIDKLNINTLITKVPEVDTLLPMLRSFEGIISTDIIAIGEFDSTLSINMPSLMASCYLRGDSLVLLDNQTFRRFSRLLLFKNKQRNLIDSIGLEIIMKNQVVSFLPFIFQMDRYKVGVTGNQYVNMDFDYNFSVLKWPLGLKMLVNYKGNMDSISNAKLKIRLCDKGYSKEYKRTGTFSIVRKQWKSIIIKKREDMLEY